MPVPLDLSSLATGCRDLSRRDPALGTLYARNGLPPLWRRAPGFGTLVKLILEQQVSLASGAAAYRRLEEELGEVDPHRFLGLDDVTLRRIGFSRQKARYVRLLAEELTSGTFDLGALAHGDDGAVTTELTRLTGVGPWTAANYLLFALGRPDAWPTGDRALVVSMSRHVGGGRVPSYQEADRVAENWRPWRAVAARLLWHDYLGGRSYDPSSFGPELG